MSILHVNDIFTRYTFNTMNTIHYIFKLASLKVIQNNYANKNIRALKARKPLDQDNFFIHSKTKSTCISLIRLYALLGIY